MADRISILRKVAELQEHQAGCITWLTRQPESCSLPSCPSHSRRSPAPSGCPSGYQSTRLIFRADITVTDATTWTGRAATGLLRLHGTDAAPGQERARAGRLRRLALKQGEKVGEMDAVLFDLRRVAPF